MKIPIYVQAPNKPSTLTKVGAAPPGAPDAEVLKVIGLDPDLVLSVKEMNKSPKAKREHRYVVVASVTIADWGGIVTPPRQDDADLKPEDLVAGWPPNRSAIALCYLNIEKSARQSVGVGLTTALALNDAIDHFPDKSRAYIKEAIDKGQASEVYEVRFL